MRKKIIILTTLLFLYIQLPYFAQAQDDSNVTVMDVQTTETTENLLLRLFFEVDGSSGETAVSEAVVLLEDGTRFPAQIEKPAYYVALVMDASGSMSPVLDEVKQAAAEIVTTAPPEVQFAVIKFDDKIDLLQPFTNDHDVLLGVLNSIQPENGGTCLYDVAYTALQSLEQISQDIPNRAMILFSDGQDQVVRGTSETCSEFTTEELLAFAANQQQTLPIHTIGIAEQESAINEETLSLIATATGGVYLNGNDENLNAELPAILAQISNFWMAKAQVLPGPGIQRGGLLLTLADGSLPTPGSFAFLSSADYRIPEEILEPVIHISNFRYDDVTDTLIFDTSLSDLDDARQLLVEVVGKNNNIQAEMTVVQNPSTLQPVRIDAENLEPEQQYIVEVMTRGSDGDLITDANNVPVLDTYEFRYDPPRPFNLTIDSVLIEDEPARFNFESFKLEDDEVMLLVEYHTSGSETLSQLNGRLLNQETNQRSEVLTLEQIEPGLAQTPITSENGSYTLVLTALDESGEFLATNNHSFTYVSPDNAVMRSGKAVQANPLLLLLFVIILLTIGYSAWRSGHILGYRTAHKNLPIGLSLNNGSRNADLAEAVAPLLAYLFLDSSPDDNLKETGRWPIKDYPFTIGREDCDISIESDRHVSRKHAQISFTNNDYFIEDLGSSNGTFVNDTQIAPREPLPLRTDIGTRIQIGKTTSFIFKVSEVELEKLEDTPESPPEDAEQA